MKFIKVSKDEYIYFLFNLNFDKYTYYANTIASRTDIREKNNPENRIGTRFIGEYGAEDSFEVREDFIELCHKEL